MRADVRALLPGLLLAPLLGPPPSAAVGQTVPVSVRVPSAAAGGGPSLLGFGATVALAGEELLVARPGEVGLFPMPPSESGAVHVFRRDGEGPWSEVATLQGSGVEPGDGFGLALAASGPGRVAVGAPGGDGGRGVVHLFERGPDGAWAETARLGDPDGTSGDAFGSAVALAGDRLLVGAPGRAGGRGAAHLFRRDLESEGWRRTAVLDEADLPEGSRYGASVAAADGRLFVGAPGPASPPGFLEAPPPQAPGAVYVYALGANGPRLEARLSEPDGEAAGLGYALAPVEGGLFVGAPTSARFEGRVYGYARGAAGWRPEGSFGPGGGGGPAFFGAGLAVAGADVLAGAPLAGQGRGGVHVFRRSGGGRGWERTQVLDVEGRGLLTAFGASLAAEGGMAAAGAPAADFFEGRAFLYARDPASGRWSATVSVVEEGRGPAPVVGGALPCAEGRAREFPCAGVDLVAFLPVRALGGGRGVMVNDLWGWTDPQTGREYALVGRLDGTAFVDVSDPENPVYLGELPLHGGASPNLWRDIKVYADHAFVVADGAGPHGMQVFDLTRLREVSDPPVRFSEDAHYGRVHSVHNLAIDVESGFAYALSASMGGETCGGGLHMIDIRDPRNPTFAGCFADPRTGNAGTGGTHDAQCVVYRGPDRRYEGREICFNASETALGIADVTEKEDPRAVAVAAYPNVAYAHQGWLSEDQRYFYLNDELDELSGLVPRTRTLVWDVADLEDPVLLTEHLGTTEATDHNLYLRGDRMYQSNYVAGLRVFDVSDPESPVEVAWFDTAPHGADAPGFLGSWSNYPFFASGVIAVTSMREGLFLLRLRSSEVSASAVP